MTPDLARHDNRFGLHAYRDRYRSRRTLLMPRGLDDPRYEVLTWRQDTRRRAIDGWFDWAMAWTWRALGCRTPSGPMSIPRGMKL